MSMRIARTILFVSIALLSYQCSKLPDQELFSKVTLNIKETNDYIILSAEDSAPTTTLIFYPGGLVDPHSYLSWQDELVSKDPSLRIVTVKMPSNLAVINSTKGSRLFDAFPETETWLIAGHSLGGAMATNMIAKYPEKLEALIYMAAYPSDDRIKNYSGGVLSISAENDGLSTQEDIEEHVSDLPTAYKMDSVNDFPMEIRSKTLYYEIQGGNHAQFGNYGSQEDDLAPTISRDQQQSILIELIQNYLDKL